LECLKETSAKELTEAHCYSRHSCSKLLLIGAIFRWSSDRMLFTLTTLKNLEYGIWCSKEYNIGAKMFYMHKNDVQSVANGFM